MTPDRAALTVLDHVRTSFGKLLRIRPPERRRRAAGPTWSVPVVAVSSEGEIPIAEVDVDDAGQMSPVLDADHVIRVLRARPERDAEDAALGGFAEADALFAELSAEAGEEESDVAASSRRLQDLFQRTDTESLLEARRLLPGLLTDGERRGRVLLMLAEVERRLGQTRLALGYVDAAAHELADRFDMITLERAASMALAIGGESDFVDSPIRSLLNRCRARLRPVDRIFDNAVLALVPREHRPLLEDHARLVVLAPGDTLVTEGEPSTAVFVIKSGVLSVHHEKPARHFVRCCSPGWLLGESSVLAPRDPRCTATLRAEHLTELWKLNAEVIRGAMRDVPALHDKMIETKTVHGLDSFFSTHESVGQLDAEVRNEMLQCVQSIQSFEEPTVVLPAGQPPAVACLVVRGRLALHDGWDLEGHPAATVGADEFFGVRDLLHGVSTPRTAVAQKRTTLVFFDGDKLRALANASPEQAAVVLERLG